MNNLENDEKEVDLNEKYLRLYAEFENYKRRVLKEKEDIKHSTKLNTLSGVLDFNDDIQIAIEQIGKVSGDTSGLNIIVDKFTKFINSIGVEEIQTDKYDSEMHDVISIVPADKPTVVQVLSRGYTLNGKVIKFPKIILGR